MGGGGQHGPLASVCGLQHRLAEGQVPVVLGAVLLKVLAGHVLRGALLKFHLAKAAILRCALAGENGTRPTPSWGSRGLGGPRNKYFSGGMRD